MKYYDGRSIVKFILIACEVVYALLIFVLGSLFIMQWIGPLLNGLFWID